MYRFLKKVYSILNILIVSTSIFGCKYSDPYDISNEDFDIRIIDEENEKVGIGNIKYQPANGVAFIPYNIDGYIVSCIGIRQPLNDSPNLQNPFINRIYLPSTIEQIGHQYMSNIRSINTMVFFCNKPIYLFKLCGYNYDSEFLKIYVPAEYYDGYKEINKWRNFYKANVYYCLNFEENDYYYIDYYKENSLIEFIPPNPVKEGYVFDGWYKEKECINKWNFESDTIKLDENSNEIKLYAKWIDE